MLLFRRDGARAAVYIIWFYSELEPDIVDTIINDRILQNYLIQDYHPRPNGACRIYC